MRLFWGYFRKKRLSTGFDCSAMYSPCKYTASDRRNTDSSYFLLYCTCVYVLVKNLIHARKILAWTYPYVFNPEFPAFIYCFILFFMTAHPSRFHKCSSYISIKHCFWFHWVILMPCKQVQWSVTEYATGRNYLERYGLFVAVFEINFLFHKLPTPLFT